MIRVSQIVVVGDIVGRVISIDDDNIIIGNHKGKQQSVVISDAQAAPGYLSAAWEFGAGVGVNGDRRTNPNAEERHDIAYYHPAKDWAAMPAADRELARLAFAGGAEAETQLMRREAR